MPVLLPTLVAAALLGVGCAGHADRTKGARSALDAAQPKAALAALNEELGVESVKEPLVDLEDDKVLFVLDRSMVLQQLNDYERSSADLQVADKRIEVLDFSRGTLDDISKYMFSDDSGPYVAPPYEKLLINTMGMLNYLARGDLSGAAVEARRFTTMQKFIEESEAQGVSLSGPGSYLAGFIFEKMREPNSALRYYDEALQVGEFQSLADPVQRLARLDSYRTPRLSALIGDEGLGTPKVDAGPKDQAGEVLVVVSYGRVPAKIAKRIPIGLALTYAALYLSPAQNSTANRLAAQGLVTWVNYPTLGKPKGTYGVPEFFVDGRQLPLEGALAVDVEARKAWKETEGSVVASAITRMITRVVAGETARKASGGGVVGTLLSLGTQATMTATDTPDTRSWGTLPARIAIGRLRVPPGKHVIRLRVRGVEKQQEVDVPPGGWAVVPLTVLR